MRKELYALPIQGSVQDFLFWRLGGVDPKNFLEPRSSEKIFWGLVGGLGACSPENFEKIMFRIGQNRISGHQ